MTHFAPEFRRLEPDEMQSILVRNNVGRLVFISGGEADVRPLHYVFSQSRIYGRSSPGAAFLQQPGGRVAFEVDEVEAVFRWKSVIARGEIHRLIRDGTDSEEWENAVRLLRRVVKNAFLEGAQDGEKTDPVPERTEIFRISIDQLTGRASH